MNHVILFTVDVVPRCNLTLAINALHNVQSGLKRADVMQAITRVPRPCVLVVEQNAIIGLSLAADLEDQGYDVAGPFACAGALAWLDAHTPDRVILDADLQRGACIELARQLRGRGIPFLVFSSHDRRAVVDEFRDVPWLSMPAEFSAVLDRLQSLPRAVEVGCHAG